jgi:hypothetical protein
MQRQFLRPLILGMAAALLLGAGPAAAKVPYFSIEVSPPDPVDGDAVVVVLRMWDDAAHTRPAAWAEELAVERGLFQFHGDGGIVPVTLQRFDQASYRGEVTLAAGTWRVVPFPPWGPDVVASGGEGYSAPASVTVRERMDSSILAVIAAAGMLGILGPLVAGRVRRGMRHHASGRATG